MKSNNRQSSSESSFRGRIVFLILSMFATMASFYVAARLWQDSEDRVSVINELDKITGQDKSSVSIGDELKIINCREQLKKLAALRVDLEQATQEGFESRYIPESSETAKTKLLAVVGIMTVFGRKKNRDAIRNTWMPTGAGLKTLEEEKGIVVRFVIGRSANDGDSSDRETNNENSLTNDIIIIENLMETPEERSKKTQSFLIHAVETWDANFYVKLNDDVFVNIDALVAVLTSNLDKPRAYIGCMKSGEVISEPKHKWYEPDWWKFGDRKSYFQHASGEAFAISQALARYISINRLILRTYANDDVSVGSWFIGLDVKHVDEGRFCCSSSSSGAICASST